MPPKNSRKRQRNPNTTSVSSEPEGSSAAAPKTPSASMFEKAKNVHIKDSSIIQEVNITNLMPVSEPALNVLHKRVATHAILNAGGRADTVRCHPGTRKEVIGRVEKWRVEAQDGSAPAIFWLSGPAGAGKSAIVQTVAEGWRKDAVPQANFFFFRTDPSRNSLSPLMATLVHQIMTLNPLVRQCVESVLSNNQLILGYSLEEQLVYLIINPLRALQNASSSYRPPVLLIDGLDECDSNAKDTQRQILHAFDKVIAEYPGCVYLLVASRDESQIRATFNQMSTPFLCLYLDDQYFPENDIRIFVNAEFAKIKKAHPLSSTLDDNWPSLKDVNAIVEKSSGHFIYVATVMRFITLSSESPILSLNAVQNAAARTTTSSPFSQLDAIYDYILSHVKDQESLQDIFHAWMLIHRASVRIITGISEEDIFVDTIQASQTALVPLLSAFEPKYTDLTVYSCLGDLTSIARYTDVGGLVFYHASFPDYLLDQSRSGNSFVDLDGFNFKIMTAALKCFNSGKTEVVALSGLSRLKALPPNLLKTMVTLNLVIPDKLHLPWILALANIRNLCICDDDLENYARIIRQWVNNSSVLTHPKKNLQFIPHCVRKHFIMISIERDIVRHIPTLNDKVALTPLTDSDAREMALWVDKLLRFLHSKMNYGSLAGDSHYDQILQRWIEFATDCQIPLVDINYLPNAFLRTRVGQIRKAQRAENFFGTMGPR